MSGVQAKKIVGYMVLPGVVPRAKKLFASGFGYIAFLIANIFGIVRLLPAAHPYMIPANIGRYGIRHVVAEAANNLVISRKNIDQIIIFLLIITGLVLMVLQIAFVIYGAIVQPALAASNDSIFVTPRPAKDIAFMLLDEVFGVPDLFKSCVALMQPCAPDRTPAPFPSPFHEGLHSMFQFYSLGLLIIGVIIFFYFVTVIVVETATSGSPFGQRFQNVWVPIRLVVALGLLVPINYGLNSAQYIVLFSAKAGSSFATNAWLRYNNITKDGSSGRAVFTRNDQNPIGESESLLARPQPPSVAPLVQALSIAKTCAYAYYKTNPEGGGIPPLYNIRPYMVKNASPLSFFSNGSKLVTINTTYAEALKFYDDGDIIVVFGRANYERKNKSDNKFDTYPGKVAPLCGSVRLPINYLKNKNQGGEVGGGDAMQEFWFDLIKKMWWTDKRFLTLGGFHVDRETKILPRWECGTWQAMPGGGLLPIPVPAPEGCKVDPLDARLRQAIVNDYNAQAQAKVLDAWDKYNKKGKDIRITEEILDRGWAGAGIWYNIIADINGGFTGAVINMPLPNKYPMLMEQVAAAKRKADAEVSPLKRFDPAQADSSIANKLNDPDDSKDPRKIAEIMGSFFESWNTDSPDQADGESTPMGNFIIDIMNLLFNADGLMGMREGNASIHPLAQLAALGKSLVDSAIIYIGVSVVSSFAGGLAAALGSQVAGAGLDVASSILVSLAFFGLTAGAILYYMVPLMPFMYFFFAVATWIKGIFEAMVGAPLWALAHLRLDGEGLPGDSASGGYYLIFDIFLRPVLSVIALIGSMLILTAQVRVLNIIWDLVVDNLTGFTGPGNERTGDTVRGVIDGYFFTILYAIVVYMLATASFKLIDAIPDNVLRYFGANTTSFSAQNQDGTEGLVRQAAFSGITFGQQITGASTDLAKGLGGGLGQMVRGGK